MSIGLGAALESFHQITWLRVTFLVGAPAGSILMLTLVLRDRRLRARPASHWRIRPLTVGQRRTEMWRLTLSGLTLIMVAVEDDVGLMLGLANACGSCLRRPYAETIVMARGQAAPGHVSGFRRCSPLIRMLKSSHTKAKKHTEADIDEALL